MVKLEIGAEVYRVCVEHQTFLLLDKKLQNS